MFNEPFAWPLPSNVFDDVLTPADKLHVSGSVTVAVNASSRWQGGVVGVEVTPNSQGSATLQGVVTIQPGSVLAVTLTARDQGGKTASTVFNVEVVGEERNHLGAILGATLAVAALLGVAVIGYMRPQWLGLGRCRWGARRGAASATASFVRHGAAAEMEMHKVTPGA